MSKLSADKKYFIAQPEAPDKCELCGAFEELRPYGPGGKRICFDCMKKDEEACKERLRKLFEGVNGAVIVDEGSFN